MDRNAVAPFYRDDHSAFETQMDFWTPDNPDARYPRPYRGGRHNYVYTDYWMIDGSYLKLTNLTLGYDLPRTLLERINIQDARLTLNGENLFTASGVPDFLDPSSGRYDRYPALRGYSIGLNITF